MHLTNRQTCRICGSAVLTPAIDLGDQHLQGSFVKPGEVSPTTQKFPTALVRCDPTRDRNACGLLQMATSVPTSLLYSSYWYRSGTNQTMRDHLRSIADEAVKLSGQTAATVLDIGCNDGTLLSFYPGAFARIGCDPSDVAKSVAGPYEIVNDFFPSAALSKVLAGRKCDVVTSIAMLYDLEDPVGFGKSLKETLAPDGLWIFEMSYLPTMLEMNSYDTICHEHLEYYSLAVIERMLAMNDLKVVRVLFNGINGGSIRCYAAHRACVKYDQSDYLKELDAVRHAEVKLALDTDAPYAAFQKRIDANGKQLRDLIDKLRSEGKSVHVYGASTKGNTILQWCGLDRTLIDCAADRNPDKDGAMTLGTNIPIVSEEKSRAKRPDYYLVLPWHFKDEFVKRERETIRAGTRMIFPLPEVAVIGPEDLKG